MKLNELFEHLINGNHLSQEQMQQVIKRCMDGELSDPQIAAFLALMRMKGETVDELTAAALMMKTYAHTIQLTDDLVDIVGTGGDGRNTFNISTISSFVAAGAGATVAKHGNHSVSSRSGSADLLLQAGFELSLPDEGIAECIKQAGITFLFGPQFHKAMRHAKPARQALKIRTLFNLLGPLLNPAGVKKQVVGVYAKHWLKPVANVLANLGSEHALVVHSRDGLDEVSIAAETDVIEYQQGVFKEWTINPKDYDCAHATLDDILVSSPADSLAIAERVFAGEKGPARDIVLLNTAAALYAADICPHYAEGVKLAADSIDSGKALERFRLLRDITKRVHHG